MLSLFPVSLSLELPVAWPKQNDLAKTVSTTASLFSVPPLATPRWVPLETRVPLPSFLKHLSCQPRVTAVEETNPHPWDVCDRSEPGTVLGYESRSITRVRYGSITEKDGGLLYPWVGGEALA